MVLGGAGLWGGSATVARVVFRDHHVPPLTVVEVRLLIACLLMVPWMVWRGPRALRVEREDWLYLVILGLLGVAAVQGTYYYSISRLGVGPAILLQYLAPALIVLYEILRGRPARVAMLIAVASAGTGTALLVGGLGASSLRARPLDWMIGFGSAVSFAFYVAYSKRGLSKYSPPTVLFYTFLTAAVFWALVTPPWRIVTAGYGLETWALFLTIGVGSTLVPFALFNAGLRRLRPAEAAVLATIEPVVAITLAAIFLGERLRGLQWLGAGLVIGATLLASAQAPENAAVAAERI